MLALLLIKFNTAEFFLITAGGIVQQQYYYQEGVHLLFIVCAQHQPWRTRSL